MTPKESILLALVALPRQPAPFRPRHQASPQVDASSPGAHSAAMRPRNPTAILLAALLLAAALAAPAAATAQDGPLIPLLTPRLHREDPRQTLARAEQALDAGDTQTAWELATEAINSGDLDQKALATAHVWRGRLDLGRSRPAAALADFRRALELAPAASGALAWRSRAWLALGRPQPALEDARRAVETTPENPAAHLSLGLALLALDRPTDALAPLSQANRLAPDDPETARALKTARKAAP